MWKLLASLAFVSFTTAACSGTAADAPTNGVNDVLKACEIRAPWTRTSNSSCESCLAAATTPRCPCTDLDYAGKCSDQQAAESAEASCEGVDTCVNKCVRTDCACIDGCYVNLAACRVRASALDGCVAEICHSYCE